MNNKKTRRRRRLGRIIRGSLKHTINLHGPITKKLIGSAAKRISGQLVADTDKEHDENVE